MNTAKFLGTPFQEYLHTDASEVSLGSDCLWFCFWTVAFKYPDLVILQKYQLLPNQGFKHNAAHIPSLSLTPTLSFGPRFCMFIINGYDRKSKRFYSGFLVCLAVLQILIICSSKESLFSIVTPKFFSWLLYFSEIPLQIRWNCSFSLTPNKITWHFPGFSTML